jgi:hypothetical protein
MKTIASSDLKRTISIIGLLVLVFLVFISSCAAPAPSAPAPTGTLAPTIDSGVDQYLSKLLTGSLVINSPQQMNINETTKVQLILSYQEPLPVLVTSVYQTVIASTPSAGTPNPSTQPIIEGTIVKIDTNMVAKLISSDFKVDPITPEMQAITYADRTVWEWEITPLKEGKDHLVVSLYIVFKSNDIQTSRFIKSFDRELVVNVPLGDRVETFWSDNWTWIVTTILIPIVVFIYRKRFSKKTPKPEPGDE